MNGVDSFARLLIHIYAAWQKQRGCQLACCIGSMGFLIDLCALPANGRASSALALLSVMNLISLW